MALSAAGHDAAEWEPPSEAELKVIQVRRERQDKISKLMSEYLLKGYRMLGECCDECGTILLQDKQKKLYCVTCQELNSDVDKDNPALNAQAALSQARERQLAANTDEMASRPEHCEGAALGLRSNALTQPFQHPLLHLMLHWHTIPWLRQKRSFCRRSAGQAIISKKPPLLKGASSFVHSSVLARRLLRALGSCHSEDAPACNGSARPGMECRPCLGCQWNPLSHHSSSGLGGLIKTGLSLLIKM